MNNNEIHKDILCSCCKNHIYDYDFYHGKEHIEPIDADKWLYCPWCGRELTEEI